MRRNPKTNSKTRETDARNKENRSQRFPKQLISEELLVLCHRKMNLIEEIKHERMIDNVQLNLEDFSELDSTVKDFTTENSTVKLSNSSKKTKENVESSHESQESREKCN